MDPSQFDRIVRQARLAPSVHNVQPARWRQVDWSIEIWCDTSVQLAVADPTGRDAALSCGAALEATVLAMGAEGIGTEVTDLWGQPGEGDLRPVARIEQRGAAKPDALSSQMEARFTHRGRFGARRLRDWARSDMVLVSDATTIAWLADLNDATSLNALRDEAFRAELLEWMRLTPAHPRHGRDGMSREAMRMSGIVARMTPKVLGRWWVWLDRFGLTRSATAEASATRSAAAVVCFHRPKGESPVETGRAYLRMWLEATARGMAGWPMAALSDDAGANAAIVERMGLKADRELIQVLRFGEALEEMPARARRPLAELKV